MNDEQMRSILDQWFEGTDPQPPNALRTARHVTAQVPQTRQRGRWLPFRLALRRWETPTVTNTVEYQPSPSPASNGHTPTVIGRTSSMLSPVKAITAGALVFAIGGVMLVAQPFGQQASVPGAEAEAVAPTWVTGHMEPVDNTCSQTGATSNGGVNRTSYECDSTWTFSDPRLSGDVWEPWTEDAYETDQGAIAVGITAYYLQNEDGGWACWSEYLSEGLTPTDPVFDNTFTCHGSGGHEGLTAVLVSTPITGTFALDFVGLIFAGDLPPVPEAPAAE